MEAVAESRVPPPQNQLIRVGIAIGIVVILVVIAFLVYSYERNAHMATQAANVATVFVKSSPRVQKNLGPIVNVKKRFESRVTVAPDAPPGWKVDFDVTGQKAKGSVEVIVRNAGGEWHVPTASLKQTGVKPIDLL